jgi:oligopeptide/dipeptide ABC transporter ATP-binding protein
MTRSADPILTVEGLSVDYRLGSEDLNALDRVSLRLSAGESLGLVGESGSGKTTMAMAVAGLLAPNAKVPSGEVRYRGERLPIDDDDAMRPHRWTETSVIFQGAMNALNPVHRVADQIAEPIVLRLGRSRSEARERAKELLKLVGIPVDRADSYPHELSGGMRQRAMIAMALACDPAIVIGDEPTTALDVVNQAQIIQLLVDLRARLGLALILITHDLSVVAEACDRVMIMYAGRIVEEASVEAIFHDPKHPYTRLLIDSIPDPVSGKRELRPIPGDPPKLQQRPAGCAFHPRCPEGMAVCRGKVPTLETAGASRVACYLHKPASHATESSQ